jgi:type II secretory pathway pseudopilin PulG
MKRVRELIRGFTLVEVIILLLILILLVAMAYPALNRIRQAKQERENATKESAAPAKP